MIRRIHVSNFRSIGENVSMELGPLTVLVGQNASGKSNVADVFQFVADAIRHGLERAVADRHGFATISRSELGRLNDISIRIEVENAAGSGFWELVLNGMEGGDSYRVLHERGNWQPILPRNHGKTAKKSSGTPKRPLAARRKAAMVLEKFLCESFDRRHGQWREPPSMDDLGAPPIAPTSIFLGIGSPGMNDLTNELANLAVYRIFPDRLREAQSPDLAPRMREHGENWASVLRNLDKTSTGPDFLAALGHIVGDIDDYRVSFVGGYLIPELRHIDPGGGHTWRGAVQESDGTLRIAGILTALLQTPHLNLIGIEEPEQTIHPGALGVLFDYLREASQRSQILLTTHSSDLLDRLDIDEIRVVDRQGGATTVSPVDEAQRSLVKKRLATVGELVFSEGLRGRNGTGTDG